ncbi:NUDIX domain-containing protein [Candidatus Campbellbacteria bacterium]|nr:MAG: NUDIX domain-containing protein [Candidatus Campbellbacteria bacterium]
MRNTTVGVVVARFQVAKLHKGHTYLIDYVNSRCDNLLIILGTARSFPTKKNPLSFEMRRLMIANRYPNAIIVPLRDTKLDSRWSTELDLAISSALPGGVDGHTVTLYGSRDSFIDFYTGVHATHLVPPLGTSNGTKNRERLANITDSVKFREGVIHTQMSRPPAVYPTVDIAIIKRETNEVLLGGKNVDGGKLRFVGGFVDPKDTSYAVAAKREVYEETTGIEIADLKEVGSARIDDWRYRGTGDSVITTFFTATYIFGALCASDDLDRLVWVPIPHVIEYLVPEHEPLGLMLLKHFNQTL